jgi:hypothetical protein
MPTPTQVSINLETVLTVQTCQRRAVLDYENHYIFQQWLPSDKTH